jgi:hypothetical protein
MPESWEEGGQEVASQTVTFGKPGDFIKGTYTGSKPVQTSLGQTVLYELKGIVGSFHNVDNKKNPVEPAVEVVAGAFYNVWRGKEGSNIEGLFKKSRLGDIVSLQFKEEKESKTKGYAPFKIMKGMQYGHDATYAGEESGAQSTLLEGSEEVADDGLPFK